MSIKLPKEYSFAYLCGYVAAIRDGFTTILDDKQDIHGATSLTIPATGWGTDSSVPDYPYYKDFTVSGLLATDIVDINIAPASALTASAAEFLGTESSAGSFRLRCKNVPAAAITAQYHITNTVGYGD